MSQQNRFLDELDNLGPMATAAQIASRMGVGTNNVYTTARRLGYARDRVNGWQRVGAEENMGAGDVYELIGKVYDKLDELAAPAPVEAVPVHEEFEPYMDDGLWVMVITMATGKDNELVRPPDSYESKDWRQQIAADATRTYLDNNATK